MLSVGGLWIGEIQQAVAIEDIGLERDPARQIQICVGVNDHNRAGRPGHIETKQAVAEAKGGVVGHDEEGRASKESFGQVG